MKFFLKYFWTLATMSIFIPSCSNNNSIINQRNSVDYKVAKDIPKYKNSYPFYYQISNHRINQLKLDNLELGYDSLQIRIWYNYSRSDIGKVIIFKNLKGNWLGEIYNLKLGEFNFTMKKDSVLSFTHYEVTPKSNWDSLMVRLMNLDIMTLPDLRSIPDFNESLADGEVYSFEIATTKNYRFYSYFSPFRLQAKYPQADKALEILKIIDLEFKIDGLQP